MARILSPRALDIQSPRLGLRRAASNLLARGMEAVLLAMACLSPWAFGATEPEFEFILYAGVAALMVAWGSRTLLERQLTWKRCPVTLCLAALTLYAGCQLIPLPHDLLSRLSPATARTYEQLLPAQAEVLPFGEAREDPLLPAGSTLSFYPGRTRQDLFRLLAVFLLFAVVRNNLASPGSMRRLSIVMLVNGALLALFALVQFFTSSDHMLYWTWPAPGTVFGPFVCRNHFAFYLNLCVGLSVGLLLGSKYFASGRARRSRDRTSLTLLQDPAALWTIAGLALMISSVAVCASRGGIVALLSGWLCFFLVNSPRSIRLRHVAAVLLTLSLVLALLTWFGLGRVQARLSTLWGREALQEGRLELWSRVLPMVKDFSVCGTGYGTFQYMEPLNRIDPGDEDVWSNAENEYLEALIEGGLVRLVLSLLTIGLVFRLGYRAVRSQERGLALGALLGFTTIVVQSFVDFGLHIPAIALLTAALCAHLCSAESIRGSTKNMYSLRLWGLAPIAGAVLAVTSGLVLSYEGWRAYQVQELRLGASSHGRPNQIDCLAAAARLAPESARLQVELALAHYEMFREERQKLRRRDRIADAAQTVCDLMPEQCPTLATFLAPTATQRWASTAEARRELSRKDERELIRKHLVPALRHFLLARDLCPLLPEPHRSIAENTDELERSDACIVYLERTRFLTPYNPALWYLCGDELLDEQSDQTWKNWRRCLELSDQYLTPILQESAARLGPREIVERVLPDVPKTLLAAALALYPESTEERRPFLDHAFALFEKKQLAGMTPEDLYVKAVIQGALDRTEEALATYRAVLEQVPHQVNWRFEFARLLYEHRHLQESRRELLIVLSQQPARADARDLLTIVERALASNRSSQHER